MKCLECNQEVTPQTSTAITKQPPKGKVAARITEVTYSCPICGETIKTESKKG